MDIERAGTQPAQKGPGDWFTGSTVWHTHPLGQTLILTEGIGRVQRDGGPVKEVRPGDVVLFAPGERHWRGASPDRAMTHIAIQEAKDGKVVDWMEHVSVEEYRAEPASD